MIFEAGTARRFIPWVATLLLALPAVALAQDDFAARCGKARWSVKTGTDADARSVDLSHVLPISIEEMWTWPAPKTIPENNRIAPYELKVYTVSATLVQTFSSSDSDYHLLLKDSSGHTLVTEVPDPNCVGASSPFLAHIRNARAQVDAKITMGPAGTQQDVSIPVVVTGVAMFDDLHGVPEAAPNGIELHPVLDIRF